MMPIRSLGGYLRDNHMDLIKKVANNISVADKLMRKTEKKLKESISSEQLRLFSTDAIYKIDKAQNLIGYNPVISIDRGLATTSAWLKHQGFNIKLT